MNDTKSKMSDFRSLHAKADPLVLWNVWDVGSAMALEAAGVEAIATGSFALSGALGYEDGELCPRDQVLRTLTSICDAVATPVSHDAERGYGENEGEVLDYMKQIRHAGAVGVNLEDGTASDTLREIDLQAARISAAKEGLGDGFLNARTDVFFVPDDRSESEKVEEVVERASAYARAGADGLFVPGLVDLDLIKTLCDRIELPINIMRPLDGPSIDQISSCGVKRISHGPFLWLQAMSALAEEAKRARSD